MNIIPTPFSDRLYSLLGFKLCESWQDPNWLRDAEYGRPGKPRRLLLCWPVKDWRRVLPSRAKVFNLFNAVDILFFGQHDFSGLDNAVSMQSLDVHW